MKYNNFKEKEKWASSLKVGDFVHDCRCEIHTIKSLKMEYRLKSWIRNILNYFYCDFVSQIWQYLEMKDWACEFSDYQITTDDDRCCSAMYCCDSIEVGAQYEKNNITKNIHFEKIEK